MPHYISLMHWTSQGMAGLPGWRERVEEGERIIEQAGGRLEGVYVTLGRYDVVEIFEAPDDEVAMEILMRLNRFAPSTPRPCARSRARRRPRSSSGSSSVRGAAVGVDVPLFGLGQREGDGARLQRLARRAERRTSASWKGSSPASRLGPLELRAAAEAIRQAQAQSLAHETKV